MKQFLKNIFNLAIQYSPLLIILSLLLLSSSGHAAGLEDIIKSYNSKMMSNIGDKFLNIDLLSWNPQKGPSIVRLLFQISFLIAFVNAMRSVGQDLLLKLFDLAIYMVIALALLGQPEAYKIFRPVFQFDTNRVDADGNTLSYTYKGNRSLDRDIYMWLSYSMDGLADSAFGADIQEQLFNASVKAGDFVDRVIKSQLNCKVDGERATFQSCALMYLKAGNDAVAAAQLKQIEDKQKAEEAAAIKAGGITYISHLLTKVGTFFTQLINPFAWFFPFLLWLFDIIRSAVNLFLLIGFGIMTAFSLFMAKIFIPFLLLPSQRGHVIKALKIPLSATMWGFVTSLIIFMSYHITDSMTNAGTSTMVEQIEKSGSLDVKVLIGVLSSMFLTQLVIAAIQIVALFKVPKISEDILNFSLAPVVGLGGELISASAGIIKMIGGLAVPAAGAALGAASAVSGAAKSAGAGLASGAIGEEGMNKIRSKVSSLTNKPASGGGSGGSGGASVGLGNVGSMKAAKDSIDSGYKDFEKSKQNAEKPKQNAEKPKQNAEKPQNSQRTLLGKAVDLGSKVKSGAGKAISATGKVAGKLGSEAGNLAVDAMTGNYSGMQSRVASGMNDASKALISGTNEFSEGLNNNQENIESRAKGATSAMMSRFQDSTSDQRDELSSSMAELSQRELAGDEAIAFQKFEEKMAKGEDLTAQDSEFLTNIQNVNLNNEQKTVVSQALNKQYDDAVRTEDFESMLKLSNNSYADKDLLEKNRQNRSAMKEYDSYFKAQEKRIADLMKKSQSSDRSVKTAQSQQELLDLVKSGFAKADSLSAKNEQNGLSVRDALKNNFKEDTAKELENLMNKENRTSAEDQKLSNLSSNNPSILKDTLQKYENKLQDIQKRNEGLDQISDDDKEEIDLYKNQISKIMDLSKNVKTTSKDKTTVDMANSFFKQIDNKSVQFDNARFDVKDDDTIDTSAFYNKKGEAVSLNKISSDAIFTMEEELKQYDRYLQAHNEKLKNNPDSLSAQDLEQVKTIRQTADIFRKLISDIKASKRKK